MFNAKKYKQRLVEIWDSLADSYDQSFSAVMYPAAMEMIEEVGLVPGSRVLDIASGTGIDAFLARQKIGSEGEIVGVDISPRMCEVGNAKAHGRGFPNVSFQCMDAEKLTFPDESFDHAFCKWGLMFFPDCNKHLKETLRVLRPGGRYAVMVLGSPSRNKFLDVAAQVSWRYDKSIFAGFGANEGPSAYRFAEEGALEAALLSAGFSAVRARRLLVMITCENADRYWELLINGNGRYSYTINRQPPEVREAIAREVKRAVEHYQADGIRLPLEVVVGLGQKPHARGDVAQIQQEALPPVSPEELYRREAEGITALTPEQAQAARSQGAVIVDVRSSKDFEASHVAGALNAPRGRLERVIADLVRQARTPVVVYGSDTAQGAFAARTLVDMGYLAIYNLHGGFSAWQGAQLAVESGPASFGRY